jgi:hypothetical protein
MPSDLRFWVGRGGIEPPTLRFQSLDPVCTDAEIR